MQRAPRISRAHAIALPRPQAAISSEWIVAAVAVAVLFAVLLGL